MATDFFDRQDEARRRSGWLVAYFVLAVLAIILCVYAAFTGILIASHGKSPGSPPAPFDPVRLAGVALITTAVIALGSLYKIAMLREGGPAVARSLGGRLVESNTRDPVERRLLNIVEEMALASGTPVPPVFLLDEEPGINAFAAGYTPGDAAIGVTRGAVSHLNRDQLQGVIAHEFSHVLNGDMRLDTKILGTVHGILLLALIGQILMRIAGNSNTSRSSRRDDDKKDNSALAFFLMGVALYIIGYLGVFFGRLIQSAVSRQREFLADASAVQFTRNPDGIAGALKKIGGLSQQGQIRSPEAGETAHMFFGQAVPSLTELMATHPPLVERIKRLDPQFDGEFPEVREDEHVDLQETSPAKTPRDRGIGGLGAALPGVDIGGGLGGAVLLPAAAVQSVGAPQPEHVAYASGLLADLPPTVAEAAREPFGASALVYAMLLDGAPEVRQKQLAFLEENAAPGLALEADHLSRAMRAVGPEARIPLIDLALPALRSLSPDQYAAFRRDVEPLVKADGRVSLFEFALGRMLFRHLDRQFLRTPAPRVRYTSLAPLSNPFATLLGSLAWIGQSGDGDVRRAYNEGAAKLGPAGGGPPLPDRSRCSLSSVDAALDELAAASPPIKRRVLDACAATIGADGRITIEEGELLRAIADSLDCPMPPLLTPGGMLTSA